ncbi:alpha/beta hydrolase [Nocardiopsis ansamitocini]|uniref:Peptidase n=1 Tax=Nocardiopsis ansamitocini TaxID=1670832 RepID=A0A9W6P3S0_9ACTN|nr:alpha/beta hydrolase [Nocardiopsis ansamitocini]GLU46493.1 peptidase [Nocardiopsis ansamitocini]
MRRGAGGAVGAVTVGTLLAAGLAAGPAVAQEKLEWAVCADLEPRGDIQPECSSLAVPMQRGGSGATETVTLALSRVPARAERAGTLVVNPGGPGSPGRDWAAIVAQGLPDDLRESYDVVSFDPRGVGASTPAVQCDPRYFEAARPSSVPADASAEKTLLNRVAVYAEACRERNGALLSHIRTVDSAHDIESIRTALGVERIDYLGYSYGTYLGGVYATLYPDSVRRIVLDSVVNPDNPWYGSNLLQSRSLDAAARNFFGWIARYDADYRLGTTGQQVAERYYSARDDLAAQPLDGIVGATEFENIFLPATYASTYWPSLAQTLSAYVRGADAKPLLSMHEKLGEDADSDPSHGAYLATQCSDARWPRDWATWRTDARRLHDEAPFMAWNNTWYNGPCMFWPVKGGPWFQVDGRSVASALIVQATEDGPTPVAGAYAMHARFPSSRLIIEQGGVTHGVSFGDNACVDLAVAAYLREGTLPAAGGGSNGADLTCAPPPQPQPRRPENAQADPDRGIPGLDHRLGA